ncbi:MAG: class I SAM-dependent methyltransferase [Saprospiraceae bacterium]|nr:class I SAM-dependent methyltransferase [Saprospiraceae bacterium]
MNDLERYFHENQDGRMLNKWMHYFDVYDRHFSRFRGQPITIMEIGVAQGGSLRMWKHYFGDQAKIYGVDLNPNCKQFEEENVQIIIGSQSDRNFLRQLKKEVPKLDILIDDGGHTMIQQIVTFEELFDHVKEDGVYLCEDLHTSYELRFGGGHKRQGTYIEYTKNFIDYINAWHSEQQSLQVTDFTKSVDSVHYYSGMIAIEKKTKERPKSKTNGVKSIQFGVERNKQQKLKKRLQKRALTITNKVLRAFRLKGFVWR